MEEKWLSDYPEELRPINYHRYVDDIFVTFRSPIQMQHFLTYMNSRHKNIRFTVEEEKENQLPILDVLIIKDGGSVKTNIYRKPTFSGVYSNFKSFLPNKYKSNLIATLLYRIHHIISSENVFNDEVNNLEKILLSNGYPIKFVIICVKRFLKSKDKAITARVDNVNEKLIIMPFLGKTSTMIELYFEKPYHQSN